MNKLLEALARSLNVSVDGISDLLSSVKDNTPQLYEQLVRECTYYTVMSKSSCAMLVIGVILIVAFVMFRYNLEVDYECIDYKEVPDNLTRVEYARLLSKENFKKYSKTFKMYYAGISFFMLLSLVFNISKYLLAPNYSFLLNEILPKLVNK
jgi:hypothetical protein|nr:MAG TPA: hypothetical protein [Caudoviricetes sp.]